ncbi:ATP-binding protein [Streptomyces sp. CAU 1734]|uniref:ATP-binding protein n=1 Tax=Streptomyces sp. CAU 1734 TaxID=3140360 RepID=UPI003260C5A7
MEVSFLPEAVCVARLRQLSSAVLHRSGLRDATAIDTVELLVSEIVTNAIAHGGGGDVTFRLALDPLGEVRIEVDDHTPGGVPEVRYPGPDEESGRGMQIVALLARSWGRKGSCTWCTVPSRRGIAA